MAILNDILNGNDILRTEGDTAIEITSLGFDSRRSEPGQLFFAVKGTASDGHDYIGQAIEKGAAAIVCERIPEVIFESTGDHLTAGVHSGACSSLPTFIVVEDTNIAMGRIASAFYGDPTSKLRLVGITGTNGKTTTATLLYDLFRKLGYEAGLISTVTYRIGEKSFDSTHTTPDAIRLNELLSQMVDSGCEYCFMEVSSHSIHQHRIEGLRFEGAIFSNITHDHLDYHGTFAEYIKAKKTLFDSLPPTAFALVNKDDRNGMVMVQNTKAKVFTMSLRSPADFKCKIIETHFDGMLLQLDGEELWVRFIGRFNASNILAVYAAARLLGATKEETLEGVSSLSAVSGRFEYVKSQTGITVIIDYAHTPDALLNVLDTINDIRLPGQKLYTVVGCGGDRDPAKRPVMGGIATENSDMAILTSDNPRTENPDTILAQMKEGVNPARQYLCINDREEAIRAAVMLAGPEDIILIAGKGHETYQEICGVRRPFDDKEVASRIMEQLNK